MDVGDTVNDFELLDQNGSATRFSNLLQNGPVVLFFYPAAMTKGCTAEACHFRDLSAEFAEAGAQPVGISADPVQRQREFADTSSLDFPLLSDPDRSIAQLFGVKRRFGPIPVKRHTFVIGADQKVRSVIRSELDMNEHADQALAVINST